MTTTIPTSDLGFIELGHCPNWCDQHHVEYATENEGILDAREVTAHYGNGGQEFLPEIRNSVDKRIERDGGGMWNFAVRQYLQEPYTAGSGYASQPLIEFVVSDRGKGQTAVLEMTTGEVRVLIAQLRAVVDKVDLSDL
jgi:hypothetical protein